LASDRAAGTGGKGQRLQQQHRGRDAVWAGHRGGAADRPVGPDDAGQRGEQLGGVERDLALRGAQFGKLKSTIQGRPAPSTTMLAARSERCAIFARCRPSASHRGERRSILPGTG
jgi:hypothetical protein